MLDTGINWEGIFWRTVPQKGTCRCWSAAAQWVSSVCPDVPEVIDPTFWGASERTSPASQKRWLSRCIQCWCDLILSIEWTFGPHRLRKMWRSFSVSREMQRSWCNSWKECPVRSSWGVWACLVCREGGWGVTPLLSTASQGDEGERWVLSSSSW